MINLNENSLSNAMKILIITTIQMREMTHKFLQDIADEIRECEDGSEALSAYEDFLPDWVLIDWEMKEMDGIAATRAIIREVPKARILLFTQYDDIELRMAAAEAGATGFVLKDNLFTLRAFFNETTKKFH